MFVCLSANFFNTCRFTNAIAQVIELRTTNFTVAHYFDLIDLWSVNRERTLHTNTVRNFTNSKCFANACTATADHNAFKKLNTLALTLDYLYVDTNGVTRSERRKILFQLFFF
ncbi:hypothetical protein MA20_48025 [Bradyrhizobium japonicum]|uniref:Uncharacterized protein n=1 Tax=Bradyrhizobium japonicum TaxID=375 RepID=A0A0A3XEH6_BRAJP|nr:hypothetical protein MA20_48025 [Bradyrhizobium japonicum]